jgi:two-component system sensor histidine kinase KdpD
LLVLIGDRPSLSSAESRVLRAISDQLALVLERDRLLRTATRAEVYRQSDHMRRSLLAAVSHDLRSPLAAIKTTATDLLDEDVQRPDAERREALEAIDRSADRLNDLIANLLDMSRIELGVLKAKIAPVGIAEPLDAAIESIAPRWPSVEVRCEVADHVVRADPVFLDRVIANVLENAVKAAAEGDDRRIEITGERAGDRCVVRIADHGPGIPDPAKEGVFHPFYRLDERDPRLGPGLGLAIVKGFLSLMDGEVWIEDTPGGGATLAFSLPVADDTT